VSFIDTGIKVLKESSFQDLNLLSPATIQINGINELNSNLFNGLISNEPFRFILEDSSLLNLNNQIFPFNDVKLTELNLINCKTDSIGAESFFDSQIDLFWIDKPNNESLSLRFRRAMFPMAPEIIIRKFKLSNVYDIFQMNSNDKRFGINFFTIERNVFKNLEELELVNIKLDFIDSIAFESLTKLSVLRLENVNLVNVIRAYFNENNLNSQERVKNFFSNVYLKKVYLGREIDNSIYENDFICYFADNHKDLLTLFYDTLDLEDGLECTCTILWLYRHFDFNIIDSNDWKYIPKCILDLKDNQSINTKFDNQCIKSGVLEGLPNEFCGNKLAKTTTTTETTTESSTKTETTTTKETTTETTTTKEATTQTVKDIDPLIMKYYELSFYLILTLFVFIIVLILFLIVIVLSLIIKSRKNNHKKNKKKHNKIRPIKETMNFNKNNEKMWRL
jgi:hypothetical protein